MTTGRAAWRRTVPFTLSALLLTGAGLILAPPASAAPGVPQLVLGNGTASGAVSMPSAAPVSIPLTLPVITIPSSVLPAVTYQPSSTVGIRWRACHNSTMATNDVAKGCFWVPTAANPDGSVEQTASVTWVQTGQVWSGAPGMSVTFTPRNMATSPMDMYLVPYIRVYAVPSNGGRSPAGMNTEFSPATTTLSARSPVPTP